MQCGASGRDPEAPEAIQGERLARRLCATCHAAPPDTKSPLADAPSFPALKARYSAREMEGILERRMRELHPRMPLLEMGPDESKAFIAYWETIKPASPRAANDADVGRAIVARDCGGCHAVGATGASPFPAAPPFRVLGARYELEGLSEALAEGISVGHPAMPELSYPADEVAAVIAFLKSIQPPTQGGGRKP